MLDLIEEIKIKVPHINLDQLNKAFELIKDIDLPRKKIHTKRHYNKHVIAIIRILLRFNVDESTIIAAILHEVLSTQTITYQYLLDTFGVEVANLVLTIESLRSLNINSQQEKSENYKKLLLAIAKDLRIILIRLADRLDIMSNLEEVKEEYKKKLAAETMQVYVPIAMHLGIYALKIELEDLAFRYLYPKEYENLERELADYKYKSSDYLEKIKGQLMSILDENDIKYTIDARMKHKFSIYTKLAKKGRSTLESIFDIFALRIILENQNNTEEDLIGKCYELLGIIHKDLLPISDRFKDYIASPKPNGYRSLHTTVLGFGLTDFNKPVEIQIRTRDMHEDAEFGLCAHFFYKQNINEKNVDINWLNKFLSIQKDISSTNVLAKDLKYDVFSDSIFVISENGDILDLPTGATALDFAYNISEDTGHRSSQVKVNGIQVPFDYILKNGDVVILQLNQKPHPSFYWISFLKTVKAKQAIQNWFIGLEEEHLYALGENILSKNLEKFDVKLDKDLTILSKYGNRLLSVDERKQIVYLLAKGELTINQVIDKIITSIESQKDKKTLKSNKKPKEILVTGEGDLPVELSACCKPEEGDSIIGYVGRGVSIKIHDKSCLEVSNFDSDRLIDVSWASKPKMMYKFIVKCHDRIGFIADISNLVSSRGYNIFELSYQANEKLQFILALEDSSIAEIIKAEIIKIVGVVHVSYETPYEQLNLQKT